MVNLKSKKLGDLLLLANAIVLVILVNLISGRFPVRLDLTEEKRYTIKEPTRKLLKDLDDIVYVEVFLEGDLNAGFKRMQRSIKETLEELRIYSGNRIVYSFTDPASAMGKKAQGEYMNELIAKGIVPENVIENKDGQRTEKLVFPGALISYGGFETGISLLKGNRAQNSQEVLNQSIEGLEFEFANAIYKLTNTDRKRIGFVTGHNELDSMQVASLNNALFDQYDVFKVDLSKKRSLENYDALIIAKPRTVFSELDKLKLDQYVMKGGKLLLLLDRLDAVMDSASRDDYFAFPYELGLDDMLFKYGVRINPDLIQDRVVAKYPIVTGTVDNRPQIMQMDWPFFPLINHYAEHAITRNLDVVLTRFVSSIDTVKAAGVRKTPLMFSSAYSRKIGAPVKVSVADLRNLNPQSFTTGNIPIAYRLEGTFNSLFANRFLPEGADTLKLIAKSLPTKIIVVGDGDIARNDVNPRTGQPQQLGRDPLSGYTFANQDLLLNMVAWLTDENGLINARNKEIKIRPLDKEKIKSDRLFWQIVNLVVPIVLIIAYGLLRAYSRKKKYSRN